MICLQNFSCLQASSYSYYSPEPILIQNIFLIVKSIFYKHHLWVTQWIRPIMGEMQISQSLVGRNGQYTWNQQDHTHLALYLSFSYVTSKTSQYKKALSTRPQSELLIFALKNFSLEIPGKNEKWKASCSVLLHVNHLPSIHGMFYFFTKNRVMSDPCFAVRDCLLIWLLSLAWLAVF